MRTVERIGNEWCLVEWTATGILARQGRVVASLKSKDRIDAECEAMLMGLL